MSGKSPMGAMLWRAEFYGYDKSGRRIGKVAKDSTIMRVRETKPHALSRPTESDDAEEQRLADGVLDRFRNETLTPTERDVYRLQEQERWEEQVMHVDEAHFRRLQLDPNLLLAERLSAEAWRVTVRRLVQYTNDEICAMLAITPRQLRSRVEGIGRKRKAAGCR